MIITRRPLTIYDVDLAGTGAMAILVLATVWAFLAPAQRCWEACYRRSAQIRATEAASTRLTLRLREAHEALQRLEAALAERGRDVPDRDAITGFLNRAALLADQCGLRIMQMAPDTPRREGAYLVSDIDMAGQGRSLDLIRFLDRLARENRYQSLRRFTVTRTSAETGDCSLSWVLRLHMLPPATGPEDR